MLCETEGNVRKLHYNSAGKHGSILHTVSRIASPAALFDAVSLITVERSGLLIKVVTTLLCLSTETLEVCLGL